MSSSAGSAVSVMPSVTSTSSPMIAAIALNSLDGSLEITISHASSFSYHGDIADVDSNTSGRRSPVQRLSRSLFYPVALIILSFLPDVALSSRPVSFLRQPVCCPRVALSPDCLSHASAASIGAFRS